MGPTVTYFRFQNAESVLPGFFYAGNCIRNFPNLYAKVVVIL